VREAPLAWPFFFRDFSRLDLRNKGIDLPLRLSTNLFISQFYCGTGSKNLTLNHDFDIPAAAAMLYFINQILTKFNNDA
jgi:hypothetical protein